MWGYTGSTSVLYIFIDGQHFGGQDDIYRAVQGIDEHHNSTKENHNE